MRMKICIVSPNYPMYFRRDKTAIFAGAEVQAAFVAGALATQGHDVSFVVANLREDDTLPFRAENAFHSADGIPGLRFFHPRVPGILRALGRVDADVYYQRNAAMLTGLTAMFCRRKGRVFVYGAGSDTDFSFRDVRMDNFRDRVLFYLGLKTAHGVVVQNEFQKQAFLKRHASPVRIIPNGIDAPDCGAEGVRDIIVWIGGLRRIKQPEIYLELARRLPGEKFVLVGGGSGVEPWFEKQILEEAAAIPNLELAGQIPHDSVRDYLKRSKMLVNTSRVEGFPNAYLEAWSLCVPVVSFNDVDGLVEKERLGAVCKGLDDMAVAVRTYAQEPERAVSAGRRAQAIVKERFSPAAVARRYTEFFEELIYRDARARRRAERADTKT
jgi:glycosyltransferase involved in cell wall biosynthesis